VAALVLLPQLWIFQGGGWNQNSRFALTRALLLRGSIQIDSDVGATGDHALRGGHVYSDKAPGLAFAAVAPLAIAGTAAAAAGLTPEQPWWWRIVPHAVTVMSVSLPVALTAAAFYGELALLFSPGAALIAVAAVFLATPLLGYAGLFYGHALAACMLAVGWLLLRRSRPALAGFVCGAAVLVEYPAALGAALLGIHVLADPNLRRGALPFALAGIPPLIVLAAYNDAAFGAPWAIGYSHLPEGTFESMKKGVYGVRLPQLQALWQITFGEHRGLFRFSPVLLLALPGAWLLARRDRRAAVLSLGLAAAFLLMNSAYAYWDGHASFGPRHALAGVGLLCLPIAAAAHRWPKIALLLLAPSLAICGLAWSTRPEATPLSWDPLREQWLHFWRTDAIGASIFWFHSKDPLDYRSGYCLPLFFGLDGRAALLPLAPLAAGLIALWHRAERPRPRP